MAEIGSAYLTILPSMKNFGSTMNRQIGPQIDSTGKTAGSRFGKFFSSTALTPMKGLVAGMGAMFAGQKIVGLFKDSIAEAREAQVTTARTENVIKSMGLSSIVTAGQIGKLAMSISNKSAVDDEAVQNGQNLLLTFGNVAKSAGQTNGVFAQSSQLMVDMSAAMGTDMKSSAIQLGKALNDPIKGVSALTRVGVSFTEQQKKQIANFVETGQMAKAQGVILGEVGKQFGGAAAAMATPADRLKVSWANFQEQIGTMLLPVVDRLMTTVTGTVLPAMSTFFEQMRSGTGAGGLLASVLGSIWSALTTVGGALVSVVGFLNQHRTAVGALAVAMGALVAVTKAHAAVVAVQAAGGLLKYLSATKLVTAATKVWTAIQWAMNSALLANPIGAVIVGIAALVAGVVIAYKKSDTFRGTVDKLWAAIKVAAGWVADITQKLAGPLVGAVGAVIGKVQSMIGWVRDKASAAWNFLKDKATDAAAAILRPIQPIIDKVQALATVVKGGATAAWSGLKSAAVGAMNAIQSAVQWVIDKVQALIDKIQSIPGIPGGPAKGNGTLTGGGFGKGLSTQPLAPRLPSTPSLSGYNLASNNSGPVVVQLDRQTLREMVRIEVEGARHFGKEINGAAASAARRR